MEPANDDDLAGWKKSISIEYRRFYISSISDFAHARQQRRRDGASTTPAGGMAADATPASGSIDAKLAAHAELARALASDVVERPGPNALLDAVEDLAHPDRLVAFAASEALGTLARRAAEPSPRARHPPAPIFPPAVTVRLLDMAAADDAPSLEPAPSKRPRNGVSRTTTTRHPGRGAFRALVLLRSAVKLEASAREDDEGGRGGRGGDDVVEAVRARRGELLSALARDAAAAETAHAPDDRRDLRLYATLRLLTASEAEASVDPDPDPDLDLDPTSAGSNPTGDDEPAIRRALRPSSPAYVAHAGVSHLARTTRRRSPRVVFDLVRDAGLTRWEEYEPSQSCDVSCASLATPSPFTRRDEPGGEDALRRRAWLACWTAARRAADEPESECEPSRRFEFPPDWPVPPLEGGTPREAARRLVELFSGEDDALVRFLDASLRLRVVVAAVAASPSALRHVPDPHETFDALIRSFAGDHTVLLDMLMDPGGKDDDGADDFRRYALGYAKAATREPERASRDVVECLAALRAALRSSAAHMPFDPAPLVRRLDAALDAVARRRDEKRAADANPEPDYGSHTHHEYE